jgi:hypothetical protein
VLSVERVASHAFVFPAAVRASRAEKRASHGGWRGVFDAHVSRLVPFRGFSSDAFVRTDERVQRARDLQRDARAQLAAGDVGVGEHDDVDAVSRHSR